MLFVFAFRFVLIWFQSAATSDDPEGFGESFRYPNDARCLPFSIASTMNLPSISNDRILVKFSSSLYILDFNQRRLTEFLSKTQEQREQLKEALHREGGRVQFVTRRYYWGDVDGMEDQEFLDAPKPPEWKVYLRTSPNPLDTDHALQFDEPPEDHRVPMPFGYGRFVLELGKEVNTMSLALVGNSVVAVPEAGKPGWVFDFTD